MPRVGRYTPNLSAEEKEEIRRLAKTRIAQKEIARRIGRHQSTICCFLKRERGHLPANTAAETHRGATTLGDCKDRLQSCFNEVTGLIDALTAVSQGIETSLRGIDDAETLAAALRLVTEKETIITSITGEIADLRREVQRMKDERMHEMRRQAVANSRAGLEPRF